MPIFIYVDPKNKFITARPFDSVEEAKEVKEAHPYIFPGEIMEIHPHVPELAKVFEQLGHQSAYNLFLEIAYQGLLHAIDEIAEDLCLTVEDLDEVAAWMEREMKIEPEPEEEEDIYISVNNEFVRVH